MMVVTALMMVDLVGPRETEPPQESRLWRGPGERKARAMEGRARRRVEGRMMMGIEYQWVVCGSECTEASGFGSRCRE